MKKCSKCKEDKDETDFYKSKTAPDGLYSSCKSCKNKVTNNWRECNHEQVRSQNNTRNKIWAKKNREKREATTKRYRESNRTKLREYSKKYAKENPGKVREASSKRRALKKGIKTIDFQFPDVFERDGYICWVCNKKVDKNLKWPNPKSPSIDHIVPISKGGSHSPNNVQCCHLGCNWKKSNKKGGQLLLEIFDESA